MIPGRAAYTAAILLVALLIVVATGELTGAHAGAPAAIDYTHATYAPDTGVLSLRFDDGPQRDYEVAFPLLSERGLRAGFAVMSSKMSKEYAVRQLGEMQTAGNEIMCHSRSHGSDPTGPDAFWDETVGALRTMEAAGFRVQSFVQPGTWVGVYNFKGAAFHGTYADRLLREHFAAYEGYIGPPGLTLPAPSEARYGRAHYSGNRLSLAALEDLVARCTREQSGIEILFHMSTIGTDGRLSDADFARFLDAVEAHVESGDLTVLTPTEQLYATPAPRPPRSRAVYSFAPGPATDWHVSPQTVQLAALHGDGGPPTIHYSLDGGQTWATAVGDRASVVVRSEGAHHFRFYADDTLGAEPVHDAGYVNIDATPPSSTAVGLSVRAADSWTGSARTVTLTATDALSGVAVTSVCVDGAAATTYDEPLVIAEPGRHVVTYCGVDAAGNREGTRTGYVSLDTGRPRTSVEPAVAIHDRIARLRFAVADPGPSCGKARVRLEIWRKGSLRRRLDAGVRRVGRSIEVHWRVTLAPGAYRLRVRATDAVGNVATRVASAPLVIR